MVKGICSVRFVAGIRTYRKGGLRMVIMYKCNLCGSTDVIRTDNADERYPDDWMLDCNKCGSWEQVGNNRPGSFTVVEG